MKDQGQQQQHAPRQSGHTTRDVEDGLASQRRTLNELSQALTDKLQTMVRQQEERAQEFARRVQSVSSLPQQPDLSWFQTLTEQMRTGEQKAGNPATSQVEKPKDSKETTSHTTQSRRPEPMPTETKERPRSKSETPFLPEEDETEEDTTKEKPGCGAWTVGGALFIIYIILKSCS